MSRRFDSVARFLLLAGLFAGTPGLVSCTSESSAPNRLPTANILQPSTDTAVLVGSPVAFEGAGEDEDGRVVEHRWEYGDGGTASGARPAPHVYRSPGVYVVTYRVVDDRGAMSVPDSVAVTVESPAPEATNYALRFYGNGFGDIDRVKVLVDDPLTVEPGPPVDVGATDFTIEFWMRALAEENGAPAVACGANENWIYGNIIVDRDRYGQDRKFGVSMAGGVIVFGVTGDGTGARTVCGRTRVDDGRWHHVAVTRERGTGVMAVFVDGALEGSGVGPGGDVSYPDDGVPGDFCGGPCVNSDPYLVFGAEKHDAGPAFPSFSGWLDEVRVSDAVRYRGSFAVPGRFEPDGNTVALYHFDEGAGDRVLDTSGAPGGPSHGVRKFGGNPPGPEWVRSDAPTGA
jgi:PKD repeat protein